MKHKRTKIPPLWVVQRGSGADAMYWHEGEDSLKEPDLYPDPTFYPSSVVAELAKANCVDVYGPEGVTVKEGEIAL